MECASCGHVNRPGARYCTSCGKPLGRDESAFASPGLGGASPSELPYLVSAAAIPFQRIRVRSLIIWGILSIPIAGIAFFLVLARYDIEADDPAVITIFYNAWFYGAILLWSIWQVIRRRVNLRRLVGPMPSKYRWGPTVGILVATAAFSVGAAQLVVYGLSTSSPEFADELLAQDLFGVATDSAKPALYLVALVLSVVVVAPVVEELLFRGIMIHRWTVKWSLGTAVVVSSLVFGLGHNLNFLGASVFGLVMALLYLRTGSLLVPMMCHMLNSGFVIGVGIMMQGVQSILGGTEPVTAGAVEDIRDGIWAGVVLVAVSAPFLLRFIYRHWPRVGSVAPYFDGPAETAGSTRPAES